MQITITLPDSVRFIRAGFEMAYDMTVLPAHILAELVEHGLTQKVGDAAAGKDGDEARAKMDMVYKSLCDGEWGVRRAGAPRADRETAHCRDVIKAWWKRWTGQPFKRQKDVKDNDALDAQWAGLSAAWQARVMDEVARRIADEDDLDPVDVDVPGDE